MFHVCRLIYRPLSKTGAVTARQLYQADYYLDPEDVVAGLEELGV